MALSEALVFRLAIVFAAVLSAAVVWRLDDTSGEYLATLRSRFLLGVPWATLTVVGFVLAIYLFVQGGAKEWYTPLVIPFRAWSYLYPLGIVTAPFSHAGPGHLLGNLIGTLTFAPIAEYAWGHYSRERDTSAPASSSSPSLADRSASLLTPVVRILAFVLGTFVVSLATSLFALGPVIGFSGVVFAFAGFAVVRYPLTTVVALSVGGVLGLLRSALSNPVTVASAEPSFGAPWWAGIAIQGHALGLLCGVLLGALLVRRREDAPPAFRLWLGVLVFAVSQSLWAVYWYRGGETFVLFRALGAALVFALAGLVAVGVAAPDRPFSDAFLPERVRALSSGLGIDLNLGSDLGLSARRLATAVLVAALLGMAIPAVPINLTAVADESTPTPSSSSASLSVERGPATSLPSESAGTERVSRAEAGALDAGIPQVGPNATGSNDSNAPSGLNVSADVEVRGYTIRYAEGVQNELVSVVDVSAFGETTAVNTSGVIVTNADREIWTTAVSKSRLAFAGQVRVRVGGLGWERTMRARRTGWDTAGGNTTYKVFLRPPGGDRRLAYAAPEATVRPTLDGKNVSVAPAKRGYTVVVSQGNDTLGRAPIPSKNGSATVAGLTFERREDRLVATYGDTEIRIAARETYRGN